MKKFKIDVIIPVYNGEKFIAQTIKSVLEQSYLPDKIIVVNDGSQDNTRAVVKQVKRTSPIPIEYLEKEHGGPATARNVGILNSDSELVAFVDADDIWEKEKLAKQISKFVKSSVKNLGVVYCNYDNVDKRGRLLPNYPSFKLDPQVRGNVRKYLIGGNKIAGSDSAVLVRRECFQKAGIFDEKLVTGEDWDMWLRISKYYNFDFVNEYLVHLRRHRDNLQSDKPAMLQGESLMVNKLLENNLLTSTFIKQFRARSIKYIVNDLPKLTMYGILNRNLTSESKQLVYANKLQVTKIFCLTVLGTIYYRVKAFFKT